MARDEEEEEERVPLRRVERQELQSPADLEAQALFEQRPYPVQRQQAVQEALQMTEPTEGVGEVTYLGRESELYPPEAPETAPTMDMGTVDVRGQPGEDAPRTVAAREALQAQTAALSEVGSDQERWEAQKARDVGEDFMQNVVGLIPFAGLLYQPQAAYEMSPLTFAGEQSSAAGKAGAAARTVAEHIGGTPTPGRAQVARHPPHDPYRRNRMQGNVTAQRPWNYSTYSRGRLNFPSSGGSPTNTDLYRNNVENALDNMRKYLNNAEIARSLQNMGPVVGDAATASSKILGVLGAGMGAAEIPLGFFREFHENRQLPNLLKTISHVGVEGPLQRGDLAPEVIEILGQDREMTHRLWSEGTVSDDLYLELVPEGERMRLTERTPEPPPERSPESAGPATIPRAY